MVLVVAGVGSSTGRTYRGYIAVVIVVVLGSSRVCILSVHCSEHNWILYYPIHSF